MRIGISGAQPGSRSLAGPLDAVDGNEVQGAAYPEYEGHQWTMIQPHAVTDETG